MARNFISPQLAELRALLNEADEISRKGEITKRDEARMNFLLAKIAMAKKDASILAGDQCLRWFKAFFRDDVETLNRFDAERRQLEAGTQTIAWTQGAEGGYLVPQEFSDKLYIGMAQYDPLLDEEIVTLEVSKDFALRPFPVPGFDLSTIAAVKIGEGSQQNPGAIPNVAQQMLNHYTYRVSLSASLEIEDDSFQPVIKIFEKAFAIAEARGIGVDLVTGNGTTAPQGVVAGAKNSGITTSAGGIMNYQDIENIYFSLNRYYRNQDKCAWLVNDSIYEQIRKAVDGNGRPLLSVQRDKEVLMGKPIHVCPSLGGVGTPGIIFGDLSYFVVRVSQPRLSRNAQASGYIEKGLALYTCLVQADAKILDPTAGSSAPIVYATLHS